MKYISNQMIEINWSICKFLRYNIVFEISISNKKYNLLFTSSLICTKL